MKRYNIRITSYNVCYTKLLRLGLINPLLRTVRLPAEFQNKHGKPLKIRIGTPINIAEQSEFSQLSDYTCFLRNKTYALGIPYHEKEIQNIV